MGALREALVSRLPQPLATRLRELKRAFVSRHFVDESKIIASFAEYMPPSESVLVDVGAHFGTVTAEYLRMGWSVIAYEPDPSNRQEFQKRLGSHPRLQLSDSAVSDQAATSMSLFTSPVSTGISSLSAFHESHEVAAEVDVVTLAEDLRARGVTRVDFLKVDVEGFDYFALKGFDWNYAPRFVLYEFEDNKTVPLGYSLRDSSSFVANFDYHLVYSVWEPIVEYGTQHTWRGLFTTPPDDVSACWGNVLCFREKSDAERCRRNFATSSYRKKFQLSTLSSKRRRPTLTR